MNPSLSSASSHRAASRSIAGSLLLCLASTASWASTDAVFAVPADGGELVLRIEAAK